MYAGDDVYDMGYDGADDNDDDDGDGRWQWGWWC